MRLLIYFLVSSPWGVLWYLKVSSLQNRSKFNSSYMILCFLMLRKCFVRGFFPVKSMCMRPLSLHSYVNQGADEAKTRLISPKSWLLGLHGEMEQTHCWQLHPWHWCLHPSPPALQHRSSLLDLQSDTISNIHKSLASALPRKSIGGKTTAPNLDEGDGRWQAR